MDNTLLIVIILVVLVLAAGWYGRDAGARLRLRGHDASLERRAADALRGRTRRGLDVTRAAKGSPPPR
jgi:hypothetical protein